MALWSLIGSVVGMITLVWIVVPAGFLWLVHLRRKRVTRCDN